MASLSNLSLSASLFLFYSNLAFSLPLGDGYTCNSAVLPITISAETTILNFAAPANQTELSGLNTALAAVNSNTTASVIGGAVHLDATYDIWTELCVPEGFQAGGTVELTVHGYVHIYTRLYIC